MRSCPTLSSSTQSFKMLASSVLERATFSQAICQLRTVHQTWSFPEDHHLRLWDPCAASLRNPDLRTPLSSMVRPYAQDPKNIHVPYSGRDEFLNGVQTSWQPSASPQLSTLGQLQSSDHLAAPLRADQSMYKYAFLLAVKF